MENTKMSCDKCNYFTHSKSDYKKHLLSTKHINQETLEILEYKYMRECKKNIVEIGVMGGTIQKK